MPQCRVVAVEGSLADVAATLRERGYQVVEPGAPACSPGVVVLTGQDADLSGMGGTPRDVPVIVARGRTAREVADEVDRRYPTTAPWGEGRG